MTFTLKMSYVDISFNIKGNAARMRVEGSINTLLLSGQLSK